MLVYLQLLRSLDKGVASRRTITSFLYIPILRFSMYSDHRQTISHAVPILALFEVGVNVSLSALFRV